MSSPTKALRLGMLVIASVAIAACSDDPPSKPSISGEPPAFLAGIWELENTVTVCQPFAPTWPHSAVTDTICIGGPDFGFENALSAWRLHADFFGLDTIVQLTSCSGFLSDTLIDVICRGTDGFLHEGTGLLCPVGIVIHTQGRPDSSAWKLIRSIDRALADTACGFGRGDTAHLCNVYFTDLKRVGDAPESCESLSDNSIGHP